MLKKHLVAWLIGTALLLLVNIVFEDRSVLDQFKTEREYIVNSMGEGAAGRIQRSTNATYSFCCSWLADISYGLFVPPTDDSQGFKESIISSHQAFWTSIYMSISRTLVVGEWGVVFWVLFIAAFMQGLTRRSIRVTNTAWSSPVKYHLALHYLVVVSGLFINYILWPWSAHPYVAALLMLMLTFTAYVIASNIQPKI